MDETLVESIQEAHHILVRSGRDHDVRACKRIADAHRATFGFLTRGVFNEAVSRGRLLVAELPDKGIVGFVRYNHRLHGSETALYDIGVDASLQRAGIGRALVHALAIKCRQSERSSIVLRCPEGAPANRFYERLGFQQCGTQPGRKRRLVVWQLSVEAFLCAS